MGARTARCDERALRLDARRALERGSCEPFGGFDASDCVAQAPLELFLDRALLLELRPQALELRELELHPKLPEQPLAIERMAKVCVRACA